MRAPGTRKRCPKYLFSDELEGVLDKASISHLVVVFLDYDGTLSPIPRRVAKLERPLSDTARISLYELSRQSKTKIFIVSGRAIESLKKLVDIDDLYYIGVHGHVIRGLDIEYTHSASTELEGIVKSIRDRILKIISGVRGVVVEDKGIALSIHYRGAGKDRSKKILEQISKICSEYYGIRLMRGKKILEILPNTGWDKGKAIDFVLAVLSSRTGLNTNNIIPIYFGDDRTDEDGFKALKGRGVGVRVGYKCNTNAEYYVNNTDDVIRFLNELKHMIARSSG